ncbi:odorant receptor 53 [Tribolium castaneum]|uniref:Odorant receptor n=1 Tax=Tribolium castaneum TaxID=7070 RepID=D6WFM4_TRICA|nr:odorant receptor 53 [Tribolium castaneum]
MGFNFQSRTNKILRRLRYVGTWFENDSYDLYFLYAVLLNIYYNLHNIAQTMNVFYHLDDIEEWSSSGLLTLTTLLTNFKAYCVLTNKKRILKLNQILTRSVFQPRSDHQVKMATDKFKIFDTMYSLHSSGPTLTVVFFSLYSLAELENRKLPFNAWYPYDFKKTPNFELTYLFQFTACMVQALIHVNTDSLAFNFIAILVIQLDFLADNLRNMCQKAESMEQSLLDCIRHHKEILACRNELYHILNVNLFGQFILSTTALCMTFLQMTVVNPTSTHFIAILVYGMALLVELLMFCWWGNELIIKSQLIPQAAFESNWMEGSIFFQKNLVFFICRAQKEMMLYAVGFFRISLNTFILVSTSVSENVVY